MPGETFTNFRAVVLCPSCRSDLWFLVSNRTKKIYSLKCTACGYYVDAEKATEAFRKLTQKMKAEENRPS